MSPMVTKILSLALLLIATSALASIDVEHATVYHNEVGTDSLVLNGSLPSNPYSSNTSGKTGITVTAAPSTATFKADATAVKNTDTGYSFYTTHGDTTFESDQTFSISGGVSGRASGQFSLTPLAGGDPTTFGFGYMLNAIDGNTTLPAGQYKLAWNVNAWTMNGTGGPGSAQFNVIVPEPTTLGTMASLLLVMGRRR